MYFMKRRDERGVAMVLFALLATMLIGTVGLSVDVGNAVLQRSRVQNAVDSAALAIAIDCAKKSENCTEERATDSANFYSLQNAGGTDLPSVELGTTTAKVHATKPVPTIFMRLLGIDSKDVSASATASWNGDPVKGGTVLPYSVSLCQYANTATGSPTILRTDMNDVMKTSIVPGNKTSAEQAHTNMTPYLAPTCAVPDDVKAIAPALSLPAQVTMLKGGLWMSAKGSSLNNGKLLDTSILEALDSVDGFNVNHMEDFAEYLGRGKILFFAIYAPRSNFDHGGLRLDGSTAAWKGTVDMKVIGYAPFEVSGWRFDNTCPGRKKCGGDVPATVGIAGKFINTVKKLPGATYGDGGTNFGAIHVKLSE